MSPVFTLRCPADPPGPAALRVGVEADGLRDLTPGVLGVNLLPAVAAPMAITVDGAPLAFLAGGKGEPVGDAGWRWEVSEGAVRGCWEMTFSPEGLEIAFDLTAHESLAALTPLAVPINANAGWLALPGRGELFDLMDRRLASAWFPLGDDPAAWSLTSQGGLLFQALDGERAFDGVRVDRLSETRWRVGLCHADLNAGDRVRGRAALRVVPFNGTTTLERVMGHAAAPPEPMPASPPPEGEAIAGKQESDGALSLTLGGQTLRVTATERGAPLTSDLALTAREEKLGDRAAWRVTLQLTPRVDLTALRFDAAITTPCGNPTWHGDATVFIPGNFARCNYHPDHPHGGGPKWGPGAVPTEREPLVENDEAPGCCHGWTFAGSRLPQVWAAAADRGARRHVWIGTTPRSPLGENCAGFVSPEGATTTLKLATPTTYEPWVPLGYSRMRPEPRRDTAPLAAGETVEWTLWGAVEETDDLNAWAPLDRALYLRCRPAEPAPRKLPLDEAAKICAAALHDRFYRADEGTLIYSTGPQGQSALVGFTGMAHSALVMLWAGQEFGNAAWREAGTRVLDTVARMFLEGPGFPWTTLKSGGGAEVEGFEAGSGEPGYVTMCAFDNLAEALRRERAWGRDHADWDQALRRCADHWVKNQSPAGAYPHWGPDFGSNFAENEYEVTNVEGGVIANMIDAFEMTGEARFLESAQRAAAFYGQHLDDGRLWGGPGDIRALVNSEVPMFLLRGFRRLFETTGDAAHRRGMLTTAAWRYGFQFAHSWPCDVGSDLWRQGWAGLGMEGASASNLHAVAFGGINVPDEWALWKITGDDYHRRRCEDLARYMTQQFARFAGDLGFPFAGAGTESWWVSDTVWGKGYPWIFTDPGFDLGYMSWVTGWSGYGALSAREVGIEV